jgi:soluble cytochrome b562
MKFRILLLVLSLMSSASILHAEEDDSPLEGQMKILARGMRQLSQQITDAAKQSENISLLEKMKKAAVDSKNLDPRKTKDIPESQRAAFLADYRTDLDELKDALDQIETTLKAGQYEKANSLLANVNSIKKEGHGKFKKD